MVQNFSRYQVFPTVGKIYDKKLKRFVKGYEHSSGYIKVALKDDNGNWKSMYFHRVILEAYRGEGIPDGLDVNHINECKTENQIKNLNLMTRKENNNWGSRTERAAKAKSKRIQAFDKQGNLVYDFPSAQEAQRQMGFEKGAISNCCKGNRQTHKGYYWRYA